MNRKSFHVSLFLCVALFLLFLFIPEKVQSAARDGIVFCATVIAPSLFPGFVLADLILSLSGRSEKEGKTFPLLFRLPSALTRCWIIGLLAGFPSAADCAVRMVRQKEITKEQGERCLAFTNNPGIVFVIATVGVGLFHSVLAGTYLWVIQTVSALLVGVLMAIPGEKSLDRIPQRRETPVSLFRVFPGAVTSSVTAVLNVCGFILFFRVLISVVSENIAFDSLKTVLAGALELTSGIARLEAFSLNSAITASFLLGWSGFSVHFQILNTVSTEDLSLKYYFPGKVFQAFFASTLTAATYPLFFEEKGRCNVIAVALLALLLFIILVVRFRREYFHGSRNFSVRKRPAKVYH